LFHNHKKQTFPFIYPNIFINMTLSLD